MAPGVHSVWLMPVAGDADILQRMVGDFAGRFGSPTFQPHLTLVEDMERSVDDLAPLVGRVAGGIASFEASVAGIGVSDLFFRSFYARFAAEGPLLELKRRAIEIILPGDIAEYMPHISLAYGVAETLEKRDAVVEAENLLLGKPVRFDRVCVVASGKELPIESWAIQAEIRLSA
ncbi:MAG: 2'-5' RNA ligase family protein [Rhizobiaceae bacterium]